MTEINNPGISEAWLSISFEPQNISVDSLKDIIQKLNIPQVFVIIENQIILICF